MGTGTAPRREATTGSQPPRQRKCTRRSAYSTHSLARPGAWPALVGSPAASGGAVISGHESEAPRHVFTCDARPGGAISSIASRRHVHADPRAASAALAPRFACADCSKFHAFSFVFSSSVPLSPLFLFRIFSSRLLLISISVYHSLVRMHTY